jgi:hypothetical protein
MEPAMILGHHILGKETYFIGGLDNERHRSSFAEQRIAYGNPIGCAGNAREETKFTGSI